MECDEERVWLGDRLSLAVAKWRVTRHTDYGIWATARTEEYYQSASTLGAAAPSAAAPGAAAPGAAAWGAAGRLLAVPADALPARPPPSRTQSGDPFPLGGGGSRVSEGFLSEPRPAQPTPPPPPSPQNLGKAQPGGGAGFCQGFAGGGSFGGLPKGSLGLMRVSVAPPRVRGRNGGPPWRGPWGGAGAEGVRVQCWRWPH